MTVADIKEVTDQVEALGRTILKDLKGTTAPRLREVAESLAKLLIKKRDPSVNQVKLDMVLDMLFSQAIAAPDQLGIRSENAADEARKFVEAWFFRAVKEIVF